MTEAQWLSATDPSPMLQFLWGKVSDRKLRLFGVACCRAVWAWMIESETRRAIELSEAFADDAAVRHSLEVAVKAVNDIGRPEMEIERNGGVSTPGFLWRTLAVVDAAGEPFQAALYIPAKLARAAEQMAVPHPLRGVDAQLVRDIFGNPYRPVDPEWVTYTIAARPVAFDPACLTSTVTALARLMYESRDFSPMPILADALQDAGCTNEDVLTHCRGSGPHVRGCWVVDLVLGKG